ncbi:MAG: cupin domain-containing protein [Gammaproteobacteria bacterium]|nr:cupin domain-containing protein [Gammaproteobacteria bacterium]
MKFSEMLAPMSEVEFARRVMAGETFFIEGSESKFEGLISLEEIEQRLNDGCNTAMPVHIIRDGQRIPLLDEPVLWSGKATRKREIGNLIANGHSFMMTNMSQMNARVSSLMDSIEGFFENAHADLHLYVSPGAGSTGYLAHRDRPQHKIYLQIIGSSTWWIYAHSASLPDDVGAVPIEQENDLLRQKMHFKLTPGDLLYMPPNVFHKVRSEAGPRVSFSIPIIFLDRSADTVRMDRTHIPLSDIMTRASGV